MSIFNKFSLGRVNDRPKLGSNMIIPAGTKKMSIISMRPFSTPNLNKIGRVKLRTSIPSPRKTSDVVKFNDSSTFVKRLQRKKMMTPSKENDSPSTYLLVTISLLETGMVSANLSHLARSS